jgi:hypothetical protein
VLWTLLVRYLRPHSRLLMIVVIFQLLQSIASLYLPALKPTSLTRAWRPATPNTL